MFLVSRLVNITQSFESWKITGQFTNARTRMHGLGSFLSTVQKQQDEGMHQDTAPHGFHLLPRQVSAKLSIYSRDTAENSVQKYKY